MEGLDIEAFTAEPEAEILNAPAPEAPAAQPEARTEDAPKPEPVEPVIETAERARDPVTGKFVSAAPEPAAETLEPAPAPAPVVQEQPRVIPLAAHLEERSRWRQELAASQQRIDEINRRVEALTPKAPEPDFLEDPKGFVDTKVGEVQKELQALKQEADALRQQQAFEGFREQVGIAEAVFVEKHPDYYEAVNHIRTIRVEQLHDLYPEATPQELMRQVAAEELRGADVFMTRGKNPAETVYRMAQQMGYRPKTAAPAPKLPTIPKAPVADPGNTLGSSGGENPEEMGEMGEDDLEPFQAALRERFVRR